MKCQFKDHYENLIVNGYCWHCKRVYGLGSPESVEANRQKMLKEMSYPKDSEGRSQVEEHIFLN